MARKRIARTRSPSSIAIGNCEVTVEAKNFTCQSDPKSLQMSLSKTSKIVISGKEEEKSSPQQKHSFMLLNPKDADSFTKSHLQEVLQLYMRELPTMNYAANTGKESTFLERCVFNGKYCTLLLKSSSVGDQGLVAAITYQIVPADTHNAEIPLAAVSSTHQHKGFGQLIYTELKRRLQSVGIRALFCWGDEESKAFWVKQGFVTIAEVDAKGRASRIPIKANIRKSLCFPGGSALMISHLNQDRLACSSFVRTETEQSECRDRAPLDRVDHNKTARIGPKSSKIVCVADEKYSALPMEGAQKRVWEASSSSLKSKKVKGSHLIDLKSDSNWSLVPESDETYYSCLHGCSLGSSISKSLVGVASKGSLTPSCTEEVPKQSGPVNVMSQTVPCKELQLVGNCFKIMLMNIADETKKTHLRKVIEDLGGSVSDNGSTCTHVVTGKVRKTLNFCAALSSGAWIVSPSWLKDSFREGRFVDELSYILNDEDYALKYKTNLRSVVLKARARLGSLLEGYSICIGAHVQPPTKTISTVIKCAGGNMIRRLESMKEASRTIFVACEEDMEEAILATEMGIWTFGIDWIMECVMRQELDLDAPQFSESLLDED